MIFNSEAQPQTLTLILQRYQSDVLRIITNGLWYITNDTLHRDQDNNHQRNYQGILR